jgi:hypothetical protein
MISMAIPFSHLETPFQRGLHDYVVAVRNEDGRIVRTYRYPSKNAALMREHDAQLLLTPEQLVTHTTEVLPVRDAVVEKIRDALQDLRDAEIAFLASRGWTNKSGKEDGSSWWGPGIVRDLVVLNGDAGIGERQETVPRKRYSHDHAVNSELCHGAPETSELRSSQEAYLRARGWDQVGAEWTSRLGGTLPLRRAVNAQKRDDHQYLAVVERAP